MGSGFYAVGGLLCAPTALGNQSKRWEINPIMIFRTWDEILPAAIENLAPLKKEIVLAILNQPGKRKLSYAEAKQRWDLDRKEFDRELAAAFDGLRRYLSRFGLNAASDLQME